MTWRMIYDLAHDPDAGFSASGLTLALLIIHNTTLRNVKLITHLLLAKLSNGPLDKPTNHLITI